jgi:phosphate-selective porin OprO/OprP
MRGTWTPWYDEATALEPNGSRGVWHVGSGYSYRSDLGYRSATTGVIARNYQVRPEANFAPVILSTSALPAVNNQLANFETALVYGPASFQSEVFADCIQQPGGTSVTFTGVYAYASYFLTGENRNYNRKLGYFDRVKPYTNFFRVRTCDGDVASGWGAWEVAYRFTHVNMLDGLPNATTPATVGLGRATDNTMGVNWYLNPYTKVMANYIFTTFERYDTTLALTPNHTVNTFEMRAQFDF